jgi:capsular polysaccharide biosynthesis protein
MVYFYRSPMAIVISAVCSIAIAAFIYFVIVKPETDKANTQVDHALKQFQPSVDQANKNLKNAQPAINKAKKLQDCVLAAGTDPAKLAACNK